MALYDNYRLRFNTALNALEMNVGGEDWEPIPGTGGGGTPGGADTQIQFNDAGAFGASSNLTWDGTVVSVGDGVNPPTTISASSIDLGNIGQAILNIVKFRPDGDSSISCELSCEESGDTDFDDAGAVQALRIGFSAGVVVDQTRAFTNNAPSAALEVRSTTKGFLPVRVTTTQRDAISEPAEGLMVYNLSTHKLNVFTTAWEQVTSA